MSKRSLLYFAALLLAVLIIVPGIAVADKCTYTDVTVSEAKNMIEEGDVFILDVRTPADFNNGYIDGAVLIPVKKLETEKNKKILVYCQTGPRSVSVCKVLISLGFSDVYNMVGGMNAWKEAGYPVVTPACVVDQNQVLSFMPKYTDVTVSDAKKMIDCDDVFILDVRTSADFDNGHIEGATLIPTKDLKTQKNKKILVYCKNGHRSTSVCKILISLGYSDVYNMVGGMDAWIGAKYPIISNTAP